MLPLPLRDACRYARDMSIIFLRYLLCRAIAATPISCCCRDELATAMICCLIRHHSQMLFLDTFLILLRYIISTIITPIDADASPFSRHFSLIIFVAYFFAIFLSPPPLSCRQPCRYFAFSLMLIIDAAAFRCFAAFLPLSPLIDADIFIEGYVDFRFAIATIFRLLFSLFRCFSLTLPCRFRLFS